MKDILTEYEHLSSEIDDIREDIRRIKEMKIEEKKYITFSCEEKKILNDMFNLLVSLTNKFTFDDNEVMIENEIREYLSIIIDKLHFINSRINIDYNDNFANFN